MTSRPRPASNPSGLTVLLLLASCAQTPTTPVVVPQAVPQAAVPRFVSPAENPKDGPCIETSHGCIALNADVSQETLAGTICSPGYTKTVRPATSYTNGVKDRLLTAAGIDLSQRKEYELDHIVPLALGGHPRKPSNLMLQAWYGPHGAKMKDILEVRLHKAVCQGQLSLLQAQQCIAQDWESCGANQ